MLASTFNTEVLRLAKTTTKTNNINQTTGSNLAQIVLNNKSFTESHLKVFLCSTALFQDKAATQNNITFEILPFLLTLSYGGKEGNRNYKTFHVCSPSPLPPIYCDTNLHFFIQSVIQLLAQVTLFSHVVQVAVYKLHFFF